MIGISASFAWRCTRGALPIPSAGSEWARLPHQRGRTRGDEEPAKATGGTNAEVTNAALAGFRYVSAGGSFASRGLIRSTPRPNDARFIITTRIIASTVVCCRNAPHHPPECELRKRGRVSAFAEPHTVPAFQRASLVETGLFAPVRQSERRA